MIKNKLKWGKCARCGIEITDNNIGGLVEAEEILICNSCENKHKVFIITELKKFRQSKEFNDKLELRKKILWASESLGNIFNNATGTIIENVYDYDKYNIFVLQITLLDILQTELDNVIYPDLEIDYSKRYPELYDLLIEVREQKGRIVSYINKEEFWKK